MLAACTQAEEVPVVQLPRTDVEEMNVSFAFREPLTLRVSQDEALLSGENTRIEVQTRTYGEKGKPAQPDGLGMWELPSTVARAVRDERSCTPLKDTSVYLPVDTSRVMLCDLVLDSAGRPIVWMVGIGRPFEGLAFMQSSFLVFEDDRYHIFSNVYPFPESDATVQWLTDTFKDRNPNMSALQWPNKSFKLLMNEVNTSLAQQVEPTSAEVREAVDALRAIAFSVGPSRALADR